MSPANEIQDRWTELFISLSSKEKKAEWSNERAIGEDLGPGP